MHFTTILDTDGRKITVNTAQITHVIPLVNGCKIHLADGHSIMSQVGAEDLVKELIGSSPR